MGIRFPLRAHFTFGLFKPPSFRDPYLGELVRLRAYWRGVLAIASRDVAFALTGRRSEPDPGALALAREAALHYAAWHLTIETALFDHYVPYAEALAAGDLPPPSDPLPDIPVASQVWPHVSLVFISVSPLEGVLTTELGYATGWDEEHTLGARFQHGRFVELCGSVLVP